MPGGVAISVADGPAAEAWTRAFLGGADNWRREPRSWMWRVGVWDCLLWVDWDFPENPMDMSIPPLTSKILLESNPPKSSILVRSLAVPAGIVTPLRDTI